MYREKFFFDIAANQMLAERNDSRLHKRIPNENFQLLATIFMVVASFCIYSFHNGNAVLTYYLQVKKIESNIEIGKKVEFTWNKIQTF